jgi:WD40 repeat protein
VVTTSYDGTARVWDVQSGQTLVTFIKHGPEHVNRVAFSPDGKMVATSGDEIQPNLESAERRGANGFQAR